MPLFLNYARGTLLLDLASTIPPLITGESHQYFLFKMLRFYYLKEVYGSISSLVRYVLLRCGLNKGNIGKTGYTLDLMIMMFWVIHILGCLWITLAKVTACSWVVQKGTNSGENPGCTDKGLPIDPEYPTGIYVTAVYWVITTLTTVGYGDYKGYTPTEYLFQMVVEFLGIGVFSYLMGSINTLVASESTLQEAIDERMEEIETWLRKLEKSR